MAVLQTPYQAFVCFANLLNSPFFHVFLKLDPQKMAQRYEIFNVCLTALWHCCPTVL